LAKGSFAGKRQSSFLFSFWIRFFVEMFVGSRSSRVKDLFKQAKDKSNAAIIYWMRCDAIGRARKGKNNFNRLQ